MKPSVEEKKILALIHEIVISHNVSHGEVLKKFYESLPNTEKTELITQLDKQYSQGRRLWSDRFTKANFNSLVYTSALQVIFKTRFKMELLRFLAKYGLDKEAGVVSEDEPFGRQK